MSSLVVTKCKLLVRNSINHAESTSDNSLCRVPSSRLSNAVPLTISHCAIYFEIGLTGIIAFAIEFLEG